MLLVKCGALNELLLFLLHACPEDNTAPLVAALAAGPCGPSLSLPAAGLAQERAGVAQSKSSESSSGAVMPSRCHWIVGRKQRVLGDRGGGKGG